MMMGIVDIDTVNCFEANKCPGLQWLGAQACSPYVILDIGEMIHDNAVQLRNQDKQKGEKDRR